MRTFAQKLRTAHEASPAKPAAPGRARPGLAGRGRDDRPAQPAAAVRPAFDLSRIPLHAAPPGRMQAKLAVGAAGDAYEQEAERAAAQVTRMPGPQLQRSAAAGGAPQTAPPAATHPAPASPGQPLDGGVRSFMEARFGADFGGVRVHTGEQAAAAARSVNALAFTVGRDIVFDRGQYAPATGEGSRLLAHELAHVLQQAQGAPHNTIQRQERTPRPAPVDAAAQRIIDLAQDAGRPIEERAVAVVRAIIDQYYAADASKVRNITYSARESGLHITYNGRGAATTGNIEVGRYFVENTTQRHFARRVAQVRHEIEHVEQQRAGMSGERRQDEREFMAFYHEALFTEPAGAGRIQRSTRVQLIDGALGYYYCLSEELRRDNATKRDELVERRAREVRASGRDDLGAAPASCRRQAD